MVRNSLNRRRLRWLNINKSPLSGLVVLNFPSYHTTSTCAMPFRISEIFILHYVSAVVVIFWKTTSLAKVEKEEKVEREERPQLARRRRNQEVRRPVFSSLLVVCTVSWRTLFTRVIVSEPLPLCTPRPFWNTSQPRYWNLLETPVRILRWSVSHRVTCSSPFEEMKN